MLLITLATIIATIQALIATGGLCTSLNTFSTSAAKKNVKKGVQAVGLRHTA